MATTDRIITIDNDLRKINIPAAIKNLGVESDDDVLTLAFRMPRYYGAVDLSEFEIRVNYMNAAGVGDVYVVTDKYAETDAVTFSWLVGRTATANRGTVKFIVCLKLFADGIVVKEYNTTVAALPVLEGLETADAVVQQYPDVLEQILRRLDEIEENGTGGGAQADFAQNDPTQPDYVKNRTHWEGYTQAAIEWDGTTDGAETFAFGDRTYHKISDIKLTAAEIENTRAVLSSGEEIAVSGVFHNGMAPIGNYLYAVNASTYTGGGDLSIGCSNGLYACIIDGVYPAQYIYNKTTVHPLDEKYIPDTIARTKDTMPLPPVAAVGQFIVVSAVDESGKVTATDAVTLADAEGVGF